MAPVSIGNGNGSINLSLSQWIQGAAMAALVGSGGVMVKAIIDIGRMQTQIELIEKNGQIVGAWRDRERDEMKRDIRELRDLLRRRGGEDGLR